jgi:hypothetical protein
VQPRSGRVISRIDDEHGVEGRIVPLRFLLGLRGARKCEPVATGDEKEAGVLAGVEERWGDGMRVGAGGLIIDGEYAGDGCEGVYLVSYFLGEE